MTSAETLPVREVTASAATVTGHLLYAGAVAVSILIDQLTKAWVAAELPLHQPVDVWSWLAPILSFTRVENTGVAFGLFPGLGGLFAVLSLLVVAGIVVFRRTLPIDDLWLHGALGLVTGGALGNVIDRVLRGHVLDFIDVNFWPFAQWPVFNLADSAVVVGVAILLVDSFLVEGLGSGASG
ncbi:MAG: signal peptidase II [Anaerolineae bacterium]|jgi:signal peptidase II|nr:signal peptidase II [Anaerolineae bacterium]